MPLGEKYEGKYKFTDVDQDDVEVSLLMGEVESLEAVITKYDNIIENTVMRYKNVIYKCKVFQ